MVDKNFAGHIWGAVAALAVVLVIFGSTFLSVDPVDVPTAQEIAAEITIPSATVDYDAMADAIIAKLPEQELPDTFDTITTRRDAHENECLELAEEELERTRFLKDLADHLEIDDWTDIDEITWGDYDVSGFSRSDVREGNCEVTLERVKVDYDRDEREKGEITFEIEDEDVVEYEFDF